MSPTPGRLVRQEKLSLRALIQLRAMGFNQKLAKNHAIDMALIINPVIGTIKADARVVSIENLAIIVLANLGINTQVIPKLRC